MKKLNREIRLWIISILLKWAMSILPKDCPKTARWFLQMPIEKNTNRKSYESR